MHSKELKRYQTMIFFFFWLGAIFNFKNFLAINAVKINQNFNFFLFKNFYTKNIKNILKVCRTNKNYQTSQIYKIPGIIYNKTLL